MKYIFIFLQTLVLVGSAVAGEQDRLIVTFASSDTKIFQVFSIPRSDAKNLPIWNPGEKEPPLSVGEAVSASEKWLSNNSDELQLENIHLAKKSSSGINDVWFYHLFYSNSPINLSDPVKSQNIVVLMDGRILASEIMTEQEFESLLMRH